MQCGISNHLPGHTVSHRKETLHLLSVTVTVVQYVYIRTHLVMKTDGVELATCQCAVPGLTSEGGVRSRLQPPPHPRHSTPFWDAQETQDKLQE
jgi:hypothetical protein